MSTCMSNTHKYCLAHNKYLLYMRVGWHPSKTGIIICITYIIVADCLQERPQL